MLKGNIYHCKFRWNIIKKLACEYLYLVRFVLFHFQITFLIKALRLFSEESFWQLHYANLISEWSLHKPYVNEVNLSGQNPPLKCC